MEEIEKQEPPCYMCKGEGVLPTTGMLQVEPVKCWVCKGRKTKNDVTKQAEEIKRRVDQATAVATERERPKTRAERLAFAIKHSTDGVCP